MDMESWICWTKSECGEWNSSLYAVPCLHNTCVRSYGWHWDRLMCCRSMNSPYTRKKSSWATNLPDNFMKTVIFFTLGSYQTVWISHCQIYLTQKYHICSCCLFSRLFHHFTLSVIWRINSIKWQTICESIILWVNNWNLSSVAVNVEEVYIDFMTVLIITVCHSYSFDLWWWWLTMWRWSS